MRKFGLIGYPLGHSFSKKYFSEKFKTEDILDATYNLYPLESIQEFPDLLKSIGPGLRGLNVTIPYKKAIIPFLNDLSDECKTLQAVNTILFKDDLSIGNNTDIIGFEESLKIFIPLSITKALILGNGGSSRAVQYVLRKLNIEFQVVSRSPDLGGLKYGDLHADELYDAKLIINTTPLGMHPEAFKCPDLRYDVLSPGHYLYDLIYNPTKTLFLSQGESQGCKIQNGMDMLYRQAEAAWKIWNQI